MSINEKYSTKSTKDDSVILDAYYLAVCYKNVSLCCHYSR